MSLKKYLDKKSMELLKYKVEFSIGIKLKSFSRQVINKDQLRKQQKTRKQRSAIVIIVKGKVEVKKLCALDLQFRGAIKRVEKYWDTKPGMVGMTCYDIGY